MHQLEQLVSALLLTYFLSRLTRRFPFAPGKTRRLLLSSAASFGLALALVVALRYPAGVFSLHSAWFLALAQVLWLVIDGMRAQRKPSGGAG